MAFKLLDMAQQRCASMALSSCHWFARGLGSSTEFRGIERKTLLSQPTTNPAKPLIISSRSTTFDNTPVMVHAGAGREIQEVQAGFRTVRWNYR